MKLCITNKDINDMLYVKNYNYNKGDVRRYGIYPDTYFSKKEWSHVLALADKGLALTFEKGTYLGNFIFKGVDSINIKFNDVKLAGEFQIIEDSEKPTNNLNFLGNLSVLDKIFIRKSSDIKFQNLLVASDTINNLHKKKNRGLSIYAGSRNIKIDTLIIKDTGGSSDVFYQHSAAAFQVHGYNSNPINIEINYLKIRNAARSAMYLTGYNHHIKKIEIENFGYGSNKNMFGLEDAKPNAQLQFTGAWFNKCNDCTIDTLIIGSNINKEIYSARFDLGTYSKPCIINNIEFLDYAKKLQILDDMLTNVLVKNVLGND
ncbi:hypothetical protein [Winogradskyella flava]|uniref:hypothetical protein n=1 Tax=Winogradskyella flava TaxID=1884876 RepID=UPI00248F78E5|nr:hypothetical protein [Winogradskyella flava]